ncbi:MAG TPA: prephenate dehydrogenase [Pseudonocardiaceae bacterium]|jgi:prephenate dehydrogenase|nr:prephenate dehydrogenase [Pseudonocardiaceae bacterium]
MSKDGLVRGVCVLGLGLIGGSVLRAAVASGRPGWGATASPDDRRAARADGFDVAPTVRDALARAAETDALVVLAAPLPAVDELLRAVADVAPACRLTDVVSVKQPVAAAVHRLTPDARYVGGHPMSGNSVSGWPAGSATLFHQAAWVVTTDDAEDTDLWADVASFALDCGAHVVPALGYEHDLAVGRVSHLPHVLAAVLASVGAGGGPLALSLAAGSFRDGTRVAGARPELTRAMCEGNRDGLLAALDEALGQLGAARGSLASTGSLGATLVAGHTGRARYDQVAAQERLAGVIGLDEPDALDRLTELGRHGGRVVAVDDAVAVTEIPAAG